MSLQDDSKIPGQPDGLLSGFLTPEQLALHLGVSLRTLARWRARRIGPARCVVGKLILYRTETIRDWLSNLERLARLAASVAGVEGANMEQHTRFGDIEARCDFLMATVPWDRSGGTGDDVLAAAAAVNLFERPGQAGVFEATSGGTIRIARRGQVLCLGFSGAVIQAMRKAGVYNDVLWALAEREHRVTRIDAAYDLRTGAPAVIRDLYEYGKVSGLRLGQRPAPVSLTGWKIGVSGEETGTLYVGDRSAELRARAYDKRQERVDKGYGDPGPWLRYEVVVTGRLGISLKDAADPTALFWHYASPTLLVPPDGVEVPRWVKGGIGFDLPQRQPVEPFERLKRAVEGSETIRHLLRLADACGRHGRRALLSLIEQLKLESHSVLPSLEN